MQQEGRLDINHQQVRKPAFSQFYSWASVLYYKHMILIFVILVYCRYLQNPQILTSSMNPENSGKHIYLRHSTLWKQPLLYQKHTQHYPKTQHQPQLNQLGMKGYAWRYRDLDQTMLGYKWAQQQQQEKAERRTRCPSASNKRSSAKEPQNDTTRRSRVLVEGMASLSERKEVEARNFTKAYYDAVGKSPFILNNYHRFPSNPSFSRNTKGKFFTS